MDLVVRPDPGEGPRAGLERALRGAVRAGRLAPGARLPGARTLATQLGLARGTVAAAYAQLGAEGWLVLRQGAAPVVAALPAGPPLPAQVEAQPTWAADLVPGSPDLAAFPRTAWLAALRRVLRSVPAAALDYGDPLGDPVLRSALAAHLGRARGVLAGPGQIVVCAGYASALSLVARLLVARGTPALAMEDPCLARDRRVVAAGGVRVLGVGLDADGMELAALRATGARAALVTPAHQYPLGVVYGPARRAALLDWARTRHALLVEDDYDGEFRYDRQPVGALQGLDPERVLYAGTASKSLAPGLRLAWLVVPARLLGLVRELRTAPEAAVLEQHALADLLESGAFDRHLRRMRAVYRRRRDQLVGALAAHAPAADVTGVAAGLHALVRLPAGGPDERRVLALAARRSLRLEALGPSWHRPARDRPQGLVVGYSRPPAHAWNAALAALTGVLVDA